MWWSKKKKEEIPISGKVRAELNWFCVPLCCWDDAGMMLLMRR